ncbi:hypothetical protein G9C85_03295 [Halorubellus sp. JP-L1]|uniref:hypothetical protein n=1 Tax=Halorubellus sp. JP-L1 TaxID=2715753 RepID=UPI00140B203A|nr:hypothetical protein [Halorubellus sp. JP-L1]NHN40662.1 hypothetical protein [Halorubellus sp. JP-L1]
MKRRGVLGALVPTVVGGCLRLEGGRGTSTGESTVRGESITTAPASTAEVTTTASELVASAEMTEQIGSATAGEITVHIDNSAATSFDGELLLLFDREVQSTQSVTVDAGAETTAVVPVDALDVGERTVSVELRASDRREVVFEETLGTPTTPLALEWGADYSPSHRTRAWSYVCYEIAIESPTGTLATYNVGGPEEGLTFYGGTYRFNPEQRQDVSRWFGGSARGTVMGFEDVDLEAATTMRLTGHLAKTIDSLPVVCRMSGLEVAERTWERDGEHTIPLTLFE